MPISPSLISVAEVTIKGVIAAGGSNGVNTQFVFHVKRSSTVPTLDKTVLNAVFQTAIVADIALALNVRWSQTENTIRWVDDALDPPVGFTGTAVGAVTGDSLPTDVSAMILLRTNLRGKNYRGAKHLGPLSESQIGQDILTGPGVTVFQQVATDINSPFTDTNGNTWTVCVLSRNLSQLRTNPTTVVATNIISTALNKRVGTMRRRKVQSVY